MDLTWRISVRRIQKCLVDLELTGIVFPICPDWTGRVGNELASGVKEAIVADIDPFISAIGDIERFDEKIQLHAVAQFQVASEAKIGTEVISTGKSISTITQAIIVGVAILIRVACDGGIEAASGSEGDDAGEFPVIDQGAKPRLVQLDLSWFSYPPSHEPVSLIVGAKTPFRA